MVIDLVFLKVRCPSEGDLLKACEEERLGAQP